MNPKKNRQVFIRQLLGFVGYIVIVQSWLVSHVLYSEIYIEVLIAMGSVIEPIAIS